ncbi:MAG: protein kinase [Myxococcota bacterium]
MNTQPTGKSTTLATIETPLIERTHLPAGATLAGRYSIRELIGEGGMGDVYLATHLAIDKKVAIKVLAPEQMRRPRTVIRFLQEAKAASRIRHENVVDINDYGESDGCAFFVMEYLEGEDLSALVKREGRQPWARIKPIAIQLLKALGAAHDAGIVHRDIKPHNCFITPRSDRRDFVKVIDFGIAKFDEGSDEQLTQTGAIMGTAEYMSPEQGMGAELDGRTDLYSVGVILYRLLTGAVPYKGNNPMAILYQHIHAQRIPPSEACPEAQIGPRLDALVLKALAKDRDDRFASAAEFIAAIEAVDEEPPPPPVVAPPSRRWSPRTPWIAGGAVAALALVVAVVFTTLGAPGTDGAAPPTAATEASVASSLPGSLAAKAEDDGPPANAAAAGAPGEPNEATPDPAADSATGTQPDKPPTEPDPADSSPPNEDDLPEPPTDPPPQSPPSDPAADPAADPATDPAPPSSSLPSRRPARAIRSRLARVRGKVRACGKKAGLFPGESVTVQLKIAPNGRVSSAKVMGAFSHKGARCIEQVVRGTRFSAARLAQTAEHRFTL